MDVTVATILADAWDFVGTLGLDVYALAGVTVGLAGLVLTRVFKKAR